jgi:hypothetical protein
MSQNLSDCILKFWVSKCHVFAGLDPPKRSQKLLCSYACYDIDLSLGWRRRLWPMHVAPIVYVEALL